MCELNPPFLVIRVDDWESYICVPSSSVVLITEGKKTYLQVLQNNNESDISQSFLKVKVLYKSDSYQEAVRYRDVLREHATGLRKTLKRLASTTLSDNFESAMFRDEYSGQSSRLKTKASTSTDQCCEVDVKRRRGDDLVMFGEGTSGIEKKSTSSTITSCDDSCDSDATRRCDDDESMSM